MGQFITRIIRSRGGRVADASQLRSLAFRHIGGGGSATSVSGASSSSVVLSFRHLAAELESCSWIDWAPQGGVGACGSGSGPCGGCCGDASEASASSLPPPPPVEGQGSGRLIGDDDACKKAKLSCEGIAATPSNEEAFSSLAADPLGGFQLVDLEPSAPPPSDAQGPAAAAPSSSSSSSSSAAAAGADIEVQVNGSGFHETPVEDLGALGVYMQTTWNPLSWILSRRMYVLVLRHPNDPSRGIRLFESMSREDAVAVGRAIASHFELGDAQRVEHEIYMAVYLLCFSLRPVRHDSCITTRRCARRSHSCTRLQISRPTAPPPPAPPPRRRRRQLHRRRRRRRRLRHRRSAGIAQSASARSSPGMRPCGAAAKAVSTTTSTPSACSNGSHSAAPAMGPRARSAEGAYSSTRSASTPS